MVTDTTPETLIMSAISNVRLTDEEKISESVPNINETIQEMGDGNYKVVMFDLDLTGRRPEDEIMQLGAFSPPKNSFHQFVMPFRNVSRASAQNHGMRIYVMFGKFRVLRSIRTGKVMKTKSLFSTLNEFLDWLKEIKGSSDGILLVYHDHRNVDVPSYLAKAIQEYKLTDDFKAVVKGIINGAKLLKGRQIETETDDERSKGQDGSISLRALTRKVLDMEREKINRMLSSARYRAEMSYKLHSKLLKCDGDITFNDIKTYAQQKN